MVKMVAKGRRGVAHDGKHYKDGETFDASDVDARYYQKRDMADVATPPSPTPPKTQRAPRVAEPTPEAPPPPVPTDSSFSEAFGAGTYGRRDMKAED